VLRYQGPKRVLRLKSECCKEKFIKGTVKHGKKIYLWGGLFSYNGMSHLYKIEGIMDDPKFKQILIHHLVPSVRDYI